MGRQSREHRERRERGASNEFVCAGGGDPKRAERIGELRHQISELADGDAVFGVSPGCPVDVQESSLEDILAFESVGSGISLFEGLQRHGVDLPPPQELDELQSAHKAMEVMRALEGLRIFLIGFEGMTACEFYSTLWNQTLWEGCYVKKRHPGAITLIDVSHKIPKSRMLQYLESLMKGDTIQ